VKLEFCNYDLVYHWLVPTENDLNRNPRPPSDVWLENNLPKSRIQRVTSHEVVQRTLLERTFSNPNLHDLIPVSRTSISASTGCLTLPADFGRTKVSAALPRNRGNIFPGFKVVHFPNVIFIFNFLVCHCTSSSGSLRRSVRSFKGVLHPQVRPFGGATGGRRRRHRQLWSVRCQSYLTFSSSVTVQHIKIECLSLASFGG
jgi:hypothetical protein